MMNYSLPHIFDFDSSLSQNALAAQLLRFLALGIPLLLIILAISVFAGAVDYGLLTNWQDSDMILNNPLITELGFEQTSHLFTEPYQGAYTPIALFAYQIQYALWDNSGFGYHLVSILLHAANGVLVFTLARRLYDNRLAAGVGALLFVIHPLQVESVVWVAQQQTLLSLLFFLLAFIFHIESKHRLSFLGLGWLLYTLAILTKPVAIGAVLIFIFYDYFWQGYAVRQVALRALPYALVGGLGLAGAVWASDSGLTDRSIPAENILDVLQLTLWIVWDNTLAFLAPFDLNHLYLYGTDGNTFSVILGGVVLVIGAAGLAKGGRFIRLSLLWIGLFGLTATLLTVDAALRADHYLYYSTVLMSITLGFGIVALLQKLSAVYLRFLASAAFVLMVFGLIFLSVNRVTVWADEPTLWANHLEDYPQSADGLLFYGIHYYETQSYDQATQFFSDVLAVNPSHYQANQYLGQIALIQQNYQAAVTYYERAIQARPNTHAVSEQIGIAYLQMGLGFFAQQDYEGALSYYRQAMQYIPQEPVLHNNIGFTLYQVGDYEQALLGYQAAVQLDPSYARAWANMGNAALAVGNYQLTRQAYLEAIELGARLETQGFSNLCLALAELGDDAELAINLCQQAINLAPNNGLYLGRFAHVLLLYGLPEQALPVAERAVAASPELSLGWRTLGDANTLLGNPANAQTAYTQALSLDPNNVAAQAGLQALQE